LIAGGVFRLGDQSRQHDHLWIDLKTLLIETLPHLPFQCSHLIQDVDHLSTGVRPAQYIGLPEPTVRRQDRQGKDHGNPAEKGFEIFRRGSLQDIAQ
jgi:hypothetical protein